MVSAHTHLFWIASRAAGTTALLLSSAAVGYGLVMSGRIVKGSGPDRRVTHEVLALSTMAAIALHGLLLIGDRYLHPSVLDVVVPFTLSYKELWTSLGIVSGWGMIILGLSYYVRGRIGQRRWKIIHRFTVLAWVGGLVHSLAEGTDAGTAWFLALVILATVPTGALLTMRLLGIRRAAAA